ncbi:MAG: hypothetical protein RLZZ613_364, partial [Pseudomonadota bacterium]
GQRWGEDGKQALVWCVTPLFTGPKLIVRLGVVPSRGGHGVPEVAIKLG